MKVELWMSWVGGIISAILIFFIGILVIAWICSRSKEFELQVEQDLFLWILGILCLAIFIGGFIVTGIHELYDKTNPISEEETILYHPVSMNDVFGSEVEQNWTYISIDAEQFYNFYYKDGDGYRIGKISSDNAIVYQTDDVKPSIVKKTSRKACGELISSGYEIYIPKDSIIEKFNVDTN